MTKTTLTLVIGIPNALVGLQKDQSLLADEIWKTSIFIGLYTNTVEPCYKESGSNPQIAAIYVNTNQ